MTLFRIIKFSHVDAHYPIVEVHYKDEIVFEIVTREDKSVDLLVADNLPNEKFDLGDISVLLGEVMNSWSSWMLEADENHAFLNRLNESTTSSD